jgi:cytochrome d ubiquinol oxidase subunit I
MPQCTVAERTPLIGFVLLYSLLGFVDIFLLVKFARKGPDRDGSGLNKPAGKGV